MADIYKINTAKAPEPIGPYSQGVQAGGFVFCSGQIAIDPGTGKLTGETAGEQTEQVCKNITAILEAVGLSFSHVVKATAFLVNSGDFVLFNNVYEKYFTSSPARSCVFVSALPKNALVEIEIIALNR